MGAARVPTGAFRAGTHGSQPGVLSSSCFARPGPKRCTNVLLLLLGELTVLHCSLILVLSL